MMDSALDMNLEQNPTTIRPLPLTQPQHPNECHKLFDVSEIPDRNSNMQDGPDPHVHKHSAASQARSNGRCDVHEHKSVANPCDSRVDSQAISAVPQGKDTAPGRREDALQMAVSAWDQIRAHLVMIGDPALLLAVETLEATPLEGTTIELVPVEGSFEVAGHMDPLR